MEQRKKHKKIYLIAGVVLAAALIAGYFFVPYAKRMSAMMFCKCLMMMSQMRPGRCQNG